MSASNRKNRSFRVENLEDRKMFAADLGGAAADLAVDSTQIPAQVADQTPAASSSTLGDIDCLQGNDKTPESIYMKIDGVDGSFVEWTSDQLSKDGHGISAPGAKDAFFAEFSPESGPQLGPTAWIELGSVSVTDDSASPEGISSYSDSGAEDAVLSGSGFQFCADGTHISQPMPAVTTLSASLGQDGEQAIDGDFGSGASGILTSMEEGETCGIFMDKGMSNGRNGLLSMEEAETCGI